MISRDTISLPEVMSFFGKTYVGNLDARLKTCVKKGVSALHGISSSMTVNEDNSEEQVFHALQAMLSSDSRSPRGSTKGIAIHTSNNTISLDELEQFFRVCKVFEELTHEQVRKVVHTSLDPAGRRLVFIPQFIKYIFDGKFTDNSKQSKMHTEQTLDAEGLLKLLMDGVRKHINVDQVCFLNRFC